MLATKEIDRMLAISASTSVMITVMLPRELVESLIICVLTKHVYVFVNQPNQSFDDNKIFVY